MKPAPPVIRYVQVLRLLMEEPLFVGLLVTANRRFGQASTWKGARLAGSAVSVYGGGMGESPKTLMVFVDGLGLGVADPDINPVYSGICPFLCQLLERHAIPVDAQLGVPGIPQSATGQASLLTGVNVPAHVGRHVEGFPGPVIRRIIEEHNVFAALRDRGYSATFANGYFVDDVEQVRKRRHQSVTTVAALAGIGHVRDTFLMLRNEAVYQDLTRKGLRERGYTGPLTSPREAGVHLLRIAQRHDFTLFEYFQTDRAGHGRDRARVLEVLSELDEFLSVAVSHAEQQRGLFVMTSDHGNVEDLTTAGHTVHPVPLVAIGCGAEHLTSRVRSLTDFVPTLLAMYPHKRTCEHTREE